MKKVAVFIGGFLFGLVIIYGWGQLFGDKDTTRMTETMMEDEKADVSTLETATSSSETSDVSSSLVEVARSGAITMGEQTAGTPVSISSVDLGTTENGGWIVVHEVKDGVIANALGAARRDAGVSTDVLVQLLRDTVVGGTYAVVLYADNGDRQFSLSTDTPLENADGGYVMNTFNIK